MTRAQRRDELHTKLDDIKTAIEDWAGEAEESASNIEKEDSPRKEKLEELATELGEVADGIDNAMNTLSGIEF